MTTCSQLEDYIAGRLSSGDTQAFEAHAVSCAACSKGVARRRAVELAARVHQRNQQARGDTATPVAPVVDRAPPPSSAPVTFVEHGPAPQTAETHGPVVNDTAKTRFVAAGVALVLTVGVVLLVRSGGHKTPPTSEPPVVTQPEPPTSPSPSPAAPAPSAPDTTTAVTPTPAPPVVTSPAPAPDTKPPPAPAAASAQIQGDSLPLDADIETIAEVVASKRCGPAVSPLRARVSKDGTDARSWGLLTQCYSKRKRWQNVLDAYEMVVRYGTPELVDSLRSTADAARAELAASDGVAATPSSP